MKVKHTPRLTVYAKRVWLALTTLGFIGLAWAFQCNYCLTIVVGDSMEPTYSSGDILLIEKQAYRDRFPLRGEVVVARCRGDLLVKRVVGLPGEEVQINQGKLIVDGAPVLESYIRLSGTLVVRKGKLAGNRFGIVGDNRSSVDSTVTGIISREEIIGAVITSF